MVSVSMKVNTKASVALGGQSLQQTGNSPARVSAPGQPKLRGDWAGDTLSLRPRSTYVRTRTSKLETSCSAGGLNSDANSYSSRFFRNGADPSRPQASVAPTAPTVAADIHSDLYSPYTPPPNKSRLRLFSGTANPKLSQDVACYMGLDLSAVKVKRFADGEIYVQIQESIRGCDVFLIQPTCPPANDHLMELLVMIDACRRASARSITAVMPYFGYARADRKTSGRESIAAKLVANMITEAGADRVLSVDLHSGQCVGYFDIPVDHVYGQCVVLDYLASKRMNQDEAVVVSPDVGGVARARSFAKKLNDAPLAIIDKRRTGHNVAEVMNLIGDVEGKVAIMVDDMIDTAGTLLGGAKLLHEMGAKEVIACCTHGVFSPPAIERLSSGLFQVCIPFPPHSFCPVFVHTISTQAVYIHSAFLLVCMLMLSIIIASLRGAP